MEPENAFTVATTAVVSGEGEAADDGRTAGYHGGEGVCGRAGREGLCAAGVGAGGRVCACGKVHGGAVWW